MQVAEQKQQFKILSLHQLTPERNDARARVEDDGAPARVDLDTSRIATLVDGVRSRCRVTSTHAPEFDCEILVHVCLRFVITFPIMFGTDIPSRKVFARQVRTISHQTSEVSKTSEV